MMARLSPVQMVRFDQLGFMRTKATLPFGSQNPAIGIVAAVSTSSGWKNIPSNAK